MKTIAVILLNFNTTDQTHACLQTLFGSTQKDISLDIVVVDNASKIPFMLTQEERTKNVRLLRSNKNLGFTGGNNLGIESILRSDTEYVMLLNNDTKIDKNMIEILAKECIKDTSVAIAVPKIYFAKGYEFHKDRYNKEEQGKVIWYAGGIIDWNNVVTKHRGVDEVDKGQYEITEETPFATGCCMLIRKSMLGKVGMLDERYFLYYEDADLTERVKRAGYKIMYVPKAYLWHETAASSGGSGSALQDYFITRNRMIYGMRYAPLRSKLALVRESIRLLFSGRTWQKRGIVDYYIHRLGKGTYPIS